MAKIVIRSPGEINNLVAKCRAKHHETLLWFVIFSALALSVGNAFDAGETAFALVTFTILVALYVRLQVISHERWLLTPVKELDACSSILASCKFSGSAVAWLQALQSQGREMYGFDVEIMSLMEESESVALARHRP